MSTGPIRKNSPASPKENAPDESAQTKLQEYREKQGGSAALLRELFGRLTRRNKHLVEHKAFHAIVAAVYLRLTEENDLSIADLIALAKVLAESRRGRAPATPPACRKLPPSLRSHGGGPFAEMVRRIYGTSGSANEENRRAQAKPEKAPDSEPANGLVPE